MNLGRLKLKAIVNDVGLFLNKTNYIVDFHQFVNNFIVFFYLCTPDPDSPPAAPMRSLASDYSCVSFCSLFPGPRTPDPGPLGVLFRQSKPLLG